MAKAPDSFLMEVVPYDLNGYQNKIKDFYKFNEEDHAGYALLALAEETGEVLGIAAKNIRDFPATDEESAKKAYENFEANKGKLRKELGDVYFAITCLIDSFGFKVEDIAKENVEKLESRLARGVISGSGDER